MAWPFVADYYGYSTGLNEAQAVTTRRPQPSAPPAPGWPAAQLAPGAAAGTVLNVNRLTVNVISPAPGQTSNGQYQPGWQDAAMSAMTRASTAGAAGMQNRATHIFVDNMTVNVNQAGEHAIRIHQQQHVQHNIYAAPCGHGQQLLIEEAHEPAHDFETNDPPFQPAHTVQGLDFGNKLFSRFYRAQKHVHAQYRTITFTQCPSAAQTFSHAVTLNLSEKRSKVVIFLFDCSLPVFRELTTNWAPNIELSEIESFLHELGHNYECHRRKVPRQRFSLYFYVVKPIGVPFSDWGRRTWNSLFMWAHDSLHDSDNAVSALSNPQVLAQVLVGVMATAL